MLISKKAEITLNSMNIKYYEEKGYKILKLKNKWGKFQTPRGTTLIVNVQDLQDWSNTAYVDVQCDGCGNILKNKNWAIYKKFVHKDGKYYCNNCAKNNNAKWISFEQWCFLNLSKENAEEILLRWDYNLNINEYGEAIYPKNVTYSSQGFNGQGYWFKCLKHLEHGSELKSIINFTHGQKGSLNCNQCNKINITHPQLIKYFVNEEDTKKYSFGTDIKVDIKCPDCGFIKKISINKLIFYGFSCTKCGDGISYPEKFMFSVLEQLNIEFQTQLSKITDEWCQDYRYDFSFILNNEHYIIETNGIQHYEESFKRIKGSKTLEEEQENDRYKKELALANGIKEENYIVIDCRYSTLEWIKNNDNGILNSRLNELFDLSKINWLKCNEFAYNSLVKKACELWSNGIKNTLQIAKILKFSSTTIIKYLKQGNELCWCDYNSEKERILNTEKQRIQVICLNTKEIFNSLKEASIRYGTFSSNISSCCKGKYKYAGKLEDGTKLIWQYYHEYLIFLKK